MPAGLKTNMHFDLQDAAGAERVPEGRLRGTANLTDWLMRRAAAGQACGQTRLAERAGQGHGSEQASIVKGGAIRIRKPRLPRA